MHGASSHGRMHLFKGNAAENSHRAKIAIAEARQSYVEKSTVEHVAESGNCDGIRVRVGRHGFSLHADGGHK